MAGPVVAGSVALFLTQFPEYPRNKIPELVRTTARQYPGYKALRGEDELELDEISISGGVLDVNAMFEAAQ